MTTARNDEQGRRLLQLLGMPFSEEANRMAKKVHDHPGDRAASTRSRCAIAASVCGRPRGYIRRFRLCRICFRELALQGKIPGVVKSSW